MPDSIFKSDECSVISFATLATIRVDGITRRVLSASGGGKIVLFAMDGGSTIAEHTNPNHAFIQVLTGSLNLVLAGEPRVLAPGEFLHMPPLLPHEVRANTPSSFLLTLICPG
ncbi:MAG TPA: cupin domain-containing protein [Rariglobus sp.]|jgi:quercetin dioxygenase-like cupin family protein|nr:cupin domain-containing protein [Rariglobus sp.]